jgi:hypothetical protein
MVRTNRGLRKQDAELKIYPAAREHHLHRGARTIVSRALPMRMGKRWPCLFSGVTYSKSPRLHRSDRLPLDLVWSNFPSVHGQLLQIRITAPDYQVFIKS